MRSERVSFLPVASLLSLLAAGGAATAAPQASGTAARLEVDALPACSTRDELVARVAARSTRIRFVNDTAGVPQLTARIQVGPKGVVVAELLVVEPDGRKFQRRIEAPSCAAATDALALVAAITLDPSANVGEVPPGGAASEAGPTSTTTDAPAGAPDTSRAVETPPPAIPQPEVEAAHEQATPPGTFRFTVGFAAQAVAGPAPAAMPGPAVEILTAYDRASMLSPALALTFAHLWSEPLTETGGIARFTLDLIGLDACPVRLTVSRLEARACAAASIGRLAAQGSRTYDPMAVARPFGSAGGTARLAILLPWHLEVRARFGAGATFWRNAFEFDPKVFHRAASVTLVGDVGIGVRFP